MRRDGDGQRERERRLTFSKLFQSTFSCEALERAMREVLALLVFGDLVGQRDLGACDRGGEGALDGWGWRDQDQRLGKGSGQRLAKIDSGG
jgi:hypothetical protein